MSFTRWYPVSSYYYDPAIQPTKPIANLQAKDENQFRKVPKGRYDTTYRREYLNFNNGLENVSNNSVDQYSKMQPAQQAVDKSRINPYTVLPPINQPPQNSFYQQQQPNQSYQQPIINHIIAEPPPMPQVQPPELYGSQMGPQYGPQGNNDGPSDSFLPVDPIYLNTQEEQNLMNDVSRELGQYSSGQLKNFYNELTSYDPNLTGYTHYTYVNLVAMRNNLPISESLMRFVMSRFVSANQPRGNVNYEELIKFLAKCLGENLNQQQVQPQVHQQMQPKQSVQPSPRGTNSDNYDPDEQAILRLMHENMRDWDMVNLININALRKSFYEYDPYNRYILQQREIEDIVYKNRIPIQRSLLYQILEKYCKVATGQYKWTSFVDFLEKTHNLKLTNKKRIDYTFAADDNDPRRASHPQFSYRIRQLDTLKAKTSEEERLEEINKQIYNLQSMKQETAQRIESRMDDATRGENWFTRFMRLANAMYSHRVNNGLEFALPKDQARDLISAYNTVYELQIPREIIEDGLNRCTLKGNVKIDDLLKVLSTSNLK